MTNMLSERQFGRQYGTEFNPTTADYSGSAYQFGSQNSGGGETTNSKATATQMGQADASDTIEDKWSGSTTGGHQPNSSDVQGMDSFVPNDSGVIPN